FERDRERSGAMLMAAAMGASPIACSKVVRKIGLSWMHSLWTARAKTGVNAVNDALWRNPEYRATRSTLSPEPSAFPPLDCANNAPFPPMRRHCGGAVYVHPPLGTGGCNAHATNFGNRDNWGWGIRGSAIDACAGVR